MTKFTNRIKPDSTELERYFLSVYTGNLWDALEKIKDWHSPEHNEKEVQMKLLKLQQQSLPVVPECVAEWISEDIENNTVVEDILTIIITSDDKDLKEYGLWIKKNPVTYVIARTLGYQVEKPQLFYLKNKLTGMWLMRDEVDEVYPYDHTFNRCHRGKFTQEEIDSMQTGSYELVPVEDGE